MLTRFHKILIGLLVLQLGLVVIVMVRGDGAAPQREHLLLAGFDAAKVTRLQIFSGPTAKPLDLVKRDNAWILASGFDYPVNQDRVNDVLTPIAKLSAPAPLATQAGRHKQLKVADGDFERKLVITRDGKDQTLFLGSSAGARRTAFRIGGSDDVYGVAGLTAPQVSAEARQYVEPTYVKIPSNEIARVIVERDGKTVELVRSETPAAAAAGSDAGSGSAAGSAAPPVVHWSMSIGGAPVALAAGESLDEATIERLFNLVATVDVNGGADPKRDASKPTATITIERKPSAASTPAPTVLDMILDGESYWVHDRSLPRAVTVDKTRLDELVHADRDKLVKKPAPPVAAPGAAPGMPPIPGAPAGSTARPPGAAAGSAARPAPGSAARPSPELR